MKRRHSEGLASELAALPKLDRQALIEHWQKLYGMPPPANTSQQFMRYAIAYRMQEQILGGLKPATHRLLIQIAEGNVSACRMPSSIKPGTRLLREWRGVTYEVNIIDKGILFQGRQYKSLSEVARVITGTRWSGPLFFGLKAGRKVTS